MSNQQVSIPELLLSLDSSELQEAEQVRAAVNHQLSSDRGGAVLSSLVDHYVDSWSCQVVQLLSSIREPHHKALLEKLNECVSRPGSRLAGVTLLGDLIRKQPPWVHHISRSPLLPSLLRCLKTDTDVVVLITGVLVLVALLPQIPQAGKQHIYDFFDVFGRLAAWSHKNPGHVPGVHRVHRVHLHAGVYSLFHRLYGMFPCNFMSYLRLHYSMKENLDTFQEVVKPMLEHVRVHPELVTGTQDYELDPSRWRCYEVHDIMIECSRVSLDPLEASCEDEPPPSAPPTHLNLTCSPGSSVLPLMPSGRQLSVHTSVTQVDDVTWSPSSQCGLSTPPPEPAAAGSAPPLSRTASISGAKCPSPASVPVMPLTEENQDGVLSPGNSSSQVKLQASPIRPITEREGGDVISSISGDVLFTSTPGRDQPSPGSALRSVSLCFTPPQDGGSAPFCQSPAPLYEPLFELALPRAAAANAAATALLTGRKTQEALERTEGEPGGGQGEDGGEDASVSPLQVLDQLIVHGHDAHQRLSRSGSLDWTLGGPAQGEELQCLRSQLLLVHSQLQYERFKRQQHAVRNRRLLRRVINTTALEEHSVAMKGQLGVQDEEIRSLKSSLQEEQRRHTHLQQDTHTHTAQLHTHIQQLLLQRDEEQRDRQRTQSELQECRSRLWDLEAELQRANNKAYNAEHQLTQLSLKVCSSEQLQQQIFLLNQQLVLLRDTNRALSDRLEAGETRSCSEASMLQCTVGKELQRLRDSDVQQRQKLEAANHRAAELESQLALKEELILDQKKLLEATKAQSRAELSACESRCVALRRVAQTLQTESLHLYSLIHLDTHTDTHLDTHTLSRPQDVRPNGAHRPRPFSSSVGILNGGVATLSTSPLLLPSCSSSPLSLSPIESPLAVGSFLEQRARQLFRPTNHSQEEEPQEGEEEEGDEGEGEEEEGEEEEAQPESPPLGQEAEEASLLTGSPPMEPVSRAPAPGALAPPSDLTLAVRQRRHELSIMDYDETVPEY